MIQGKRKQPKKPSTEYQLDKLEAINKQHEQTINQQQTSIANLLLEVAQLKQQLK